MSVVVVMGVSGVGKTTVGKLLAQQMGWGFAEGDSYHSEANVEKMRSGTPLTDEDRWPWLQAIALDIEGWISRGEGYVVTCSALKKRYRDILSGSHRDKVLFLNLQAEAGIIEARLKQRAGHYMPASLLTSQLATLEAPGADENALTVRSEDAPLTIVTQTIQHLKKG